VRSHAGGDEPAVSEADLCRLAGLAVEVERRFGTPVDVEAALSGDWQLIQARPITTR
jgi:phosphoenolpyruvate synthase/pyruvate phosphate dikinase